MAVQKERTLAVTILAVLAGVAGVLSLVDAARYMGWLPIATLGDMKFVLPDAAWFAAILAAIVGVIFFVVASWIWNLNPSGWLFVVAITIFNLLFLFVAILGQTTLTAVLPAVVINGLALILAIIPSTKEAFRVGGMAMAAEEMGEMKEQMQEAAAEMHSDLTRIEGVGPQIQSALMAAGIHTYDDVANASIDVLNEVASQSGAIADASTWPKQARLAADGKWSELEAYQADLTGGRTE